MLYGLSEPRPPLVLVLAMQGHHASVASLVKQYIAAGQFRPIQNIMYDVDEVQGAKQRKKDLNLNRADDSKWTIIRSLK